jgi:hypothetical protein
MFYLVCFNCDLILIEHRNKHIVTFFWTIALNWVHIVIFWPSDILGAKWYQVQAFLNLTLEKTIKPQALVARTTPPFSNFLFTNLFSTIFFFIISSLFPYFNLFVSTFIQSYVNIKLHVSTLLVSIIGSTHAIWC